jgi:hypothetical protein
MAKVSPNGSGQPVFGVRARKLIEHLGTDSIDALRHMSIVYLGIGAHAVANDMIIAIDELALSSHSQVQDSALAALQERLLKTADPVDRLIARLAENLGLAAKSETHWSSASERVLIRA